MSIIPDTPDRSLTPDEAVQALRALRARIPNFTLLSTDNRKLLAPAAAVNPRFQQAAINAIAVSARLRDALGRDAVELRQTIEEADRWLVVIQELDALRTGITDSLTVSRHRVGGTALRTYQVARQLARYDEQPELLPLIDSMRRAAKSSRARPAPRATPPVDAPETPPST